MAYTDFNDTMFRGDEQPFTITVTKNGTPLDVTDCVFWMTAKANLSDPPWRVIFSAGSENGRVTLTNPSGGIVTITLASEDTANVNAEVVAFCDVQVRDTTGAVTTIATGKLTILLDVTQES